MNIIIYFGCIVIALFITLWQSILHFRGAMFIQGNKNIWLSLLIGSSFGVMFLSIGFFIWSKFEHTWISLNFGVIYYFVVLLVIVLIDFIILTQYKTKIEEE